MQNSSSEEMQVQRKVIIIAIIATIIMKIPLSIIGNSSSTYSEKAPTEHQKMAANVEEGDQNEVKIITLQCVYY